MENKPAFVHRDGMLSDSKYVEWLSDVKARFSQSQKKAAVRVNTAMLEFYWGIGRDLVALHAEERWGAGVMKQFALDMRQAFPEITGFSDSNIKYMKRWYLFYYEKVIIGQQLVDQFGAAEKGQQVVGQIEGKEKTCEPVDSLFDIIGHQVGGQFREAEKGQQVADQILGKEESLQYADCMEDKIGQQAADQLEMPETFGRVPWFHHVLIVSKCQSLDEALFYINKVSEEGWSRSFLENQIAAKLFQTQGAAVTNFERTLPSPQNVLAKEILKDPYHFDFLSMRAELRRPMSCFGAREIIPPWG